jgi:hypothetical protein
MNVGALTLACLLYVAGQNPSDGWATNQRDLKIPIDIKAWRPESIHQLVLYVSTDRGRNWQQHSTVKPRLAPQEKDENYFVFRAQADGEYWFRVVVVDLKGNQEPRDVTKGAPDQKILIDTRPPVLQILSAHRLGDDVVVDWNVQEDHPDWTSFKLEYRRADGSANGLWSPAPVSPGVKGPGRFRVSYAGPLKVRLMLKDAAENVAVSAEFDVAGTNGITPVNFPAQVATQSEPPKTPTTTGNDAAPMLPPPPEPNLTGPGSLPQGPPPAYATQPPVEVTKGQVTPPSVDALPVVRTNATDPGRAVASTDVPNPVVPPPAPGNVASPMAHAAAPHKITNRLEVTVKYELAQVGPSGVGSVDIYMTKDHGATWIKDGDDPTIKAAVPAGPGEQTRTLKLPPQDGVYGYTLVAKSRAGRGKLPPRPGDQPELIVELDRTAPKAVLYAPLPDPAQRDALILTWKAEDKNLAAQPITIEYKDASNGEWKTIGTKLPNTVAHAAQVPPGVTGSYSWQVPPGTVSAYLRLRVHDTAGNEAQAATAEPLLVDMSEPVAHKLRVID